MPYKDLPPFISTDDLAALLGITLADPNALIVKISLDSGCDAVRSYLGQDVNLVSNDIVYLDGPGYPWATIRLKERPVRAVDSVSYAYWSASGVQEQLLTANTYRCDTDGILELVDGTYWMNGIKNIKVQYDHGWDIVVTSGGIAVPADIRLVALSCARRVYTSLGEVDDAGAFRQETMGTYSYSTGGRAAATSAAELLPAETAVLDRYRIGLVP